MILSQRIERVAAKKPLADGTNFFPHPAANGVFALEPLWRPMGSSPRAAHIRDRQKGADETYHPIVGVSDVMEQLKLLPFVQVAGSKIRLYLP